MRHRLVMLTVLVVATGLLIGLGALFGSTNAEEAHAQGSVTSSSLAAVPAASSNFPVNSPSADGGNNSRIWVPFIPLDPSEVAALISAVGVVTAALIVRKRRRQRLVPKQPSETESPPKNQDYIQQYRGGLLNDPRITSLQILDMKRPLDIRKLYVPLRLSQEVESSDELVVEAKDDLNPSPQASRQHLSNRSQHDLEPEKAISTCYKKRCVIVGDPGAGKTTLLKYLAVQSANRELTELPGLPVYIELNAFANSGKNDLLDFASTHWEEKYGIPKKAARECIKQNLEAGNILLLLDGLDETVIGETFNDAEESYKRIANVIMQFTTQYYQSPIVVTARKAGYRQRTHLEGFTETEVLDFRPEDIKKFVSGWFDCDPGPQRQNDARNLNVILERNPRIQALAANPLLLAIIVIVYEERKSLPSGRAKLYRECVEILLIKWDANRNIRRRREFPVELKERLLEDVAWHFHTRGRRYFPKGELQEVIEEFLIAVNVEEKQKYQILNEIANENGLLKELVSERYGFLHLTLQEYFVARQASEQGKLDILLSHIDEPWWEEVMLLYTGSTGDASSLLEKLLERDNKTPLQEDIFHTNLILAGRCITTRAPIRQPLLREEIISRLFDTLANTPYSLTRQQVIEVLTEIDETEVNTRLLNLLSDENIDKEMRQNIATTLGKIGKRSVIPNDLLPLLYDRDIDKDVRIRIAEALGTLGDHSVVPDLLQWLRNPNINVEVRGSIADALGTLGASGKLEGTTAVSDLEQLLSDQQIGSDVCGRIADALGKLGIPSLAPKLLEKLSKQEIDPHVRMRIANALAMLGDSSVIDKLLRLLSEQRTDQGLRMSIADTIGSLGNQSRASKLLDILENPKDDPKVRGHVATALGKLGGQFTVSKLLDLLSNSKVDSFIRQRVAIALGELGADPLAPNQRQELSEHMLLLLSDETDQSVGMCIANALSSLGERSIAFKLPHLLSKEHLNPHIRAAIADTLGLLGERSITQGLEDLLFNPNLDLNIRGHIASALGMLGKRSASPMLLDLLTEERLDPDVRRHIADGLGALNEPSLPPKLVPLLSRPDISKDVRKHLANAFVQLADDEETVAKLTGLLQTSDIADDIHRTLWAVSHRVGVRVFVTDTPEGKKPEVVKWRTEFGS